MTTTVNINYRSARYDSNAKCHMRAGWVAEVDGRMMLQASTAEEAMRDYRRSLHNETPHFIVGNNPAN